MYLKHILPYSLMAGVVITQNSIVESLNALSSQLESMTKAVNIWNGDVIEGSDIFLKAEDMIDLINKSSASASIISPLTLNQAVTMLKPTNNLIALTENLVDSLISKKLALDKTGLSSVVKETFPKVKTAATKFVNAIQNKLPENAKPVAKNISQKLTAAMDKGINAYQ
jgi:hypothetical protein